jgi:hypothetical protein
MMNAVFKKLGAGALGLGLIATIGISSAYAGDLVVTVRDADGAPVADAVVKVIPKGGAGECNDAVRRLDAG